MSNTKFAISGKAEFFTMDDFIPKSVSTRNKRILINGVEYFDKDQIYNIMYFLEMHNVKYKIIH